MSDKLIIGIADMKMAKGEGMLVTYALGSCPITQAVPLCQLF